MDKDFLNILKQSLKYNYNKKCYDNSEFLINKIDKDIFKLDFCTNYDNLYRYTYSRKDNLPLILKILKTRIFTCNLPPNIIYIDCDCEINDVHNLPRSLKLLTFIDSQYISNELTHYIITSDKLFTTINKIDIIKIFYNYYYTFLKAFTFTEYYNKFNNEFILINII